MDEKGPQWMGRATEGGGTPVDGENHREDPNGWGEDLSGWEKPQSGGGPNGKDGRAQWMGIPWMEGKGETWKGWEPTLTESPQRMDSPQ